MFEADTDKYRSKILELESFQENDLITMCTLLCLDYAGEKADLIIRIIEGLSNLEIVKEGARREDTEEDDDNDEDELNLFL